MPKRREPLGGIPSTSRDGMVPSRDGIASESDKRKDGKDGKGDVSAIPDATPDLPGGLPAACARDGETRRQTWERLRREARAAGMTRKASISYATEVADQFHPHFPPAAGEPAEIAPPAAPEPEGVTGLGDLPASWPALPPNAPLRSEVEWVTANRLVCVDGHTVVLSRALCPPPSHAALSWLDTAIMYPAKFADICVRAAAHDSTEERELIKRERIAIEDVRQLLAEMRGE